LKSPKSPSNSLVSPKAETQLSELDPETREIAKATSLVRDLETASGSAMRQLLDQASELDISLSLLQQTGIGKAIKKAGKRAADPEVKKKADAIVAKWKAQMAN